MKAPALRAVARSYRAERGLTGVIGLLALLAGAAALVVGAGWLGRFRAARPVLDPVAVDALGKWPVVTKAAAIVLGLLLVVLGVGLALRALRPERHPDLVLADDLTVTSGAIASAIAADAERVTGVDRAKAVVVGSREAPALRLSLWLAEGADVKAVWQELDDAVLANARHCLGVAALPTAVRMELGAAERTRVR
ncbi:alkaline shock response membrane anchor protein AmaP [Actinokineospora sp. NPDC004072]